MGEAKTAPCTTETKTDCIRRVREAATHKTTLPILQASAAPHGGVSAEPPVPPVGKEPREDNQHPQHCGSLHGSPYSSLASWGL